MLTVNKGFNFDEEGKAEIDLFFIFEQLNKSYFKVILKLVVE